MSHRSFVVIPPDSSGKKVATEERTFVDFDNQTGAFFENDVVTGFSSNATGIITAIEVKGFAPNSGRLFLRDIAGLFLEDENLQVSAATKAVVDLSVNAQQTVNTQHMVIADADNPAHTQKIDEFGATVTTFTEGAPQFGPFGQMMVTDAVTIGDHDFVYGLQSQDFYDNTSGGGTVTLDSDTSSTLLTCGTTSGDLTQRTSHQYHQYRPGVGNLIEMSVVLGDIGKTNLRRRWGLFDNNNGIFFELNDQTFRVVLRSNTTGSVVDTVIDQANFSKNKLNGSDARGFVIDLTKTNIYWMDFQWLGAGKIRYGVFRPSGERIVVHVIENSNINERTFMGTGSLPIRIEQQNTSTTGSSSEFRLTCAVVKNLGLLRKSPRFFSTDTGVTRISVANTDGEVPLISFRPRTTFQGKPNHVPIIFRNGHISNNTAFHFIFRVRTNVTSLTAESWANHDTINSSIQIDTSATAFTGGSTNVTAVIGQETKQLVPADSPTGDFSTAFGKLELSADEATQPIMTITVEVIDVGSATIFMAINWDEEQI